jgi:hypothetical protein
LNTEYTPQNALANLANFVLKQEDAPCSAESHLNHAIFVLSEMSAGWRPKDEDICKVIRDAREHMAHYFDDAKKPWNIQD